jgi:hypothetical protein
MARRKDGTAKRFEFQVFADNEQGRAIAERLFQVQDSGGNITDFIRDALWFFIQNERGNTSPRASTASIGTLEREIGALLERVQNAPRLPALEPVAATTGNTSGLDMSARRRPSTPKREPASVPPTPPEPNMDTEEAGRRFLASVMAQVARDTSKR